MAGKEGRGGRGGRDQWRKVGVEGDLELVLPLPGTQFPTLYNGGRPKSGAVSILQNCTARWLRPATTTAQGLPPPLSVSPWPAFQGLSPTAPTSLLPSGSTPSPRNAPTQPRTNALQLEPADRRLAPSPPGPARHFQSLQCKTLYQIHRGCPAALPGS